MGPKHDPRRLLIKEVWPDKLLYGTLLIVVSSAMGLLHGLLVLTTELSHGQFLQHLAGFPVILTVVFSLGALVIALIAWRRLSVWLGMLAGGLGVASLSLFGIGTLHALAALVFLLIAKSEEEDKVPPEHRVDKWEWPDKAFAASLLLLLAGSTSVAWGVAVLFGQATFGGQNEVYWGTAQVVAGVVAIVAAELVYRQRGLLFAMLACVLSIVAFAGYVIAPGLAVAALIALVLGWREHEFQGTPVEPLVASDPPRSQR